MFTDYYGLGFNPFNKQNKGKKMHFIPQITDRCRSVWNT